MANVFAIHSVGNSIVTYLRNSYPQAPAGLDMPDCAFELVSSGELAGDPGDATPTRLRPFSPRRTNEKASALKAHWPSTT